MKTPITFKNIFVSILSLLISITSFVTLTTHLNSQAAEPTQFVWVDKAKATSPLYTTVAGNETANFSIYDTTNGILCSVELSRKPDNAEIKYTIDKTNIGKGWMPYVLNPKLVKAGRIITYTSDRLIVEGNATTFKTSTSTKKYRRSDRKYSTKPLTDVKAIDKKYLDSCNTTGGIKSVEKMFKDEKGVFFKVPAPVVLATSNLTYLSQTNPDKPYYYDYSVLDSTTGQFCRSRYDSIIDRATYNYYQENSTGQYISTKKGKIPLDSLKNFSKTKDNYFNSNFNAETEWVSIRYNMEGKSFSFQRNYEFFNLDGKIIQLNEIPAIPQEMLSDCMKVNGIKNALDTYPTRFKDDGLKFSTPSSNLTYLSQTNPDKPYYYDYSVLDSTTGQFCRSRYDSIIDRATYNYYQENSTGQYISTKKGKIPLDSLKNFSKTKDNYFNSNFNAETEWVSIRYNMEGKSFSFQRNYEFFNLDGKIIQLNEIPAIPQEMLSDCMKVNGIKNALDTYPTRFKDDGLK